MKKQIIHKCINCGQKLIGEDCPKIDVYGNHWCRKCYETKCANELKQENEYDNIESMV